MTRWLDVLRPVAGGLVIVGLSLFAVAWTSMALVSEGADFNQNVGVANILGAFLTALGLVGMTIGWLTRNLALPAAVLEEKRAWLAAKVEEQERLNRQLILGAQRDIPARPALSNGAETRLPRGIFRFRRAQAAVHDLTSIGAYYEELDTRRLLITGAPGAGKTVLLIELALQLIERNKGEGAPVPVRISMAGWQAENVSAEELIVDRIARDHSIAPRVVRKLVARKLILPLLDGLDEMERAPGHSASADYAVQRLNEFHTTMRRSVVTCREEDFRDLRKSSLEFQGTVSIQVLPMDVARIEEYVREVLRGNDDLLSAWEEKLAHMRRHPDGPLARVLSAPLWLFLATRSRQGLEILAGDTPVEDVKGRLLTGFVAEAVSRGGRYSEPEVRRWLAELSRLLHRQAEAGGSGTDIVPYRIWRAVGRVSTALAVGVVCLGTLEGAIRRDGPPGVVFRLVEAVTTCALVIVVCRPLTVGPRLGSFFAEPDGVVPSTTDSLRRMWRSYSAIWRPHLRLLALAVAAFTVSDAVTDLSTDFDWGSVMPNILQGFVKAFFVVAGLVYLRYSLRAVRDYHEAKMEVRSRSKSRAMLRSWIPLLAFASFILLIAASRGDQGIRAAHIGLYFRDPAGWVMVLVLFGIFSAVFLCNAFALAYEACRGRLPWRFGRFLDWGVEVGLLRLSGTAYQFRHIELQRLLNR